MLIQINPQKIFVHFNIKNMQSTVILINLTKTARIFFGFVMVFLEKQGTSCFWTLPDKICFAYCFTIARIPKARAAASMITAVHVKMPFLCAGTDISSEDAVIPAAELTSSLSYSTTA